MGACVRAVILVSGLVQGVGYRYFVLRKAHELGLAGYARNLSNGDVEVLAQGERETIERLVQNLRMGPRSAIVRDVAVSWEAASERLQGFEVF